MKENEIINSIKALINTFESEKSISIRQLLAMQISSLAVKLSNINKL